MHQQNTVVSLFRIAAVIVVLTIAAVCCQSLFFQHALWRLQTLSLNLASYPFLWLEGLLLISQHIQEALSYSSRAESTQPLSLVCSSRPIELACTCTKLKRVHTASQPCLWLEELLWCIPDSHEHKASEHIPIWPLQILPWLQGFPAGLQHHQACEHIQCRLSTCYVA